MMEKMVGMMPIKSTRFILSVRNLLLFGQTSSRRKYLALTFESLYVKLLFWLNKSYSELFTQETHKGGLTIYLLLALS